jgi:hypothetical protein
MLGQFLEFSLVASPLAPAFEFYTSLGFEPLLGGDLLKEPYVPLFDGSVVIGLHDREGPAPQLTFVRPGLRDYARAIRRVGIEFDYLNLANDEFHRLGFSCPDGQSVGLIEARTCAPGALDASHVSGSGSFLEYSLAVDSIAAAQTFWTALGFEVVATGEWQHRWVRLAGRGLVLGLHEGRFRPGLTFRGEHLDARLEYLRAKGLGPKSGSAVSTDQRRSATLVAPEGTVLYLLDAALQDAD